MFPMRIHAACVCTHTCTMMALAPNLWTLQLRSRTACEETSLGALPASTQPSPRMTRTLLSKTPIE
jgi:hypothetical protein